MKLRKRVYIFIFSLIFLLLIGIYHFRIPITERFRSHRKTSVTIEISDPGFPAVRPVEDTSQPVSSPVISAKVTVNSTVLPVNNVLQLPQLPTGCEITALTTVLNYLGYPVDKEDMARDYLDKAEPYSGSFNEFFIGSPWDKNGWGCFAPVIVKSAKKFLNDQNSRLRVYNITGSPLEDLLFQVQSGHPVIVWTSRDIRKRPVATNITLKDGSAATWYSNEHCVVLIGYNLKKGTVTISDPLEGITEHSYVEFSQSYDDFQRMAVVIE